MIWRLGALVIAALVALPIVGVASSLFGDALRDAIDPKLRDR